MPEMIEIKEIKPGGRSVINHLMERMADMSRRSDDVSEALGKIREYMRDEFKYEFSSANPAGWSALTAKYKSWKAAHGYPVTIGIMTGALKDAMTTSAIVDIGPKSLLYKINDGVIGYKGKSVGEYAKYFNGRRPIVPHVADRVRGRIKEAVKSVIKQGYDKSL
jgi:hypothetical protein